MRAMRGFGRWQPLAACLAVGAIAFFGLSLEGARAGKEPGSPDRSLRDESAVAVNDSATTETGRVLHSAELPLDRLTTATQKDPNALVQNPLGSETGVSTMRRHIPGDALPIAPPVRVNPYTDEASMMRARGELVGPWRPNAGVTASGGCPANNCTFDIDCDDCNPCTTDTCIITPSQPVCAGTCSNTAIGDGNGAAACSDGVFCNGIEVCMGGNCQAPGLGTGTASDPDDQIPCTSVCAGGTRNGKRCAITADCTGGGTCVPSVCNEDSNECVRNCNSKFCNDASTNKGKPCNVAGDCPGGDCLTGAALCEDGIFCNGAETCGSNGVCDSPGEACGPGADCSELTCASAAANGCFSAADCASGTCEDRNRLGCFRGRCCTKGTGCVVNADCDPDGSGPIAGGTCTAGQCSNIVAGDQACAQTKFSACQGPNKGWYALGSGGRPALGQAACPIVDPVPGLGNVNYQCPKYSSGIAPRPTEYVVNVGPVSDSVCEGFTEVGDDYTVSNGSHIALETFVFAGGVVDPSEERIAFEFYDSAGNFIEDVFFVSGAGVAVRTVLIDPPITIPPSGFVVARAASAFAPNARVVWASTTAPTWVGTNDVNILRVNGATGDHVGECVGGSRDGLYCDQANGNADCPNPGVCTDRDDVLAFELSGDKVPAPTGACCDNAGNCSQVAKWICSADPTKTFIDGPCNLCSDDSPVAGQSCTLNSDCKKCTAGSNAGNSCNVNGDCPGSSCVGGVNDGDACTIPTNCPGGICTAGQCLGSCQPQCNTGSCCNPVSGACLTGFTQSACEATSCTGNLCVGGLRAGLSCTSAAQCGVFNGYGTDCDPNCCKTTGFTGANDCAGTTPNVANIGNGTCSGPKKCDGGSNPGTLCPLGTECTGGGTCEFTCVGSSNAGDTCTSASNCPINSVYLTISGDNSGATGPDSCTANQFDPNNGSLLPYEVDLGWWERYDITGYSCAYVTMDMCCSVPLHAPQWILMWDRCPCESSGFRQWVASENPNKPDLLANARGAPVCPPGDDNLWWQYGPLPAGSYWQPIYSAQAGAHGPYQMHINVERCPEAACCYLRCENGGVPLACSQDSDCPGVPGVRACVGGECVCPGSRDSECGGGGNTCEPVCDLLNVLDCTLPPIAPDPINAPNYKGRGGTYLGLPFVDPANTFCTAGLCDNGSCCRTGGLCDDVNPNLTPFSKEDCDGLTGGVFHGGTLCYGGTCSGGTRDGLSCNDNSLCPPSGTCVGSATQLAQRTCPICEFDNDAHCQTGEGPYGFISDDSVGGFDTFNATSRIADDFVADETGSLTTVCVEGFYRTGAGANCGGVGSADDKFKVNVYNNANALPGTLVGTSNVTGANLAKGSDAGGNLFIHQLTLDTPIAGLVNGTTYWLEVFNNTLDINGADDGCNWFWLASDFGQGNNYAMQDLGQSYGPEDAIAPPEGAPDMHWCLNLRNHAPTEPLRACCLCQSSGGCNSGNSDPCCKDASFFECSIENKAQWIFSQNSCAGFTCPVTNAPVHDECLGAITVSEGTNIVNNDCATDTLGALGTLTCEGSTTPFKADVWYKYINTCPGDVQIEMCDNGNGAQDTVMAVYGNHTGTCPCPVVGTDQIGDCNDDGCFWGGTGGSLVIPDASANVGDCLLIRLAGFFDDDGAYFRNNKLKITCQGQPAPQAPTGGSDDKCAGGTNPGTPCKQNSDCTGGGFCQLKNRFITAVIPATATANGLKVNIVSVDTNSVATPSNYNGTDRWVGAPLLNVSDGVSPAFNAGKLQCTFFSADWSAIGQLHIYGDIVVPASSFDVFSCNPQANCSSALRIGTAKWGDIIAPLNVTNFQDIVSIVAKFQGTPAGPSKTRTKLAEPVNPSTNVNFQEVSADVAAFQGKTYKQVFPGAPVICP